MAITKGGKSEGEGEMKTRKQVDINSLIQQALDPPFKPAYLQAIDL